MNKTIELILNRVCVRDYKPDQVKEEDLKTIIDCGLHAATAMNMQPWHLTVIQNKQVIDQIVEINKKAILESDNEFLKERVTQPGGYHNFYHAPTVIIVSGRDGEKWADVDCANMTQNMCIAAEALGLSTCYIASFKFAVEAGGKYAKELLDLLQLPEGYSPRVSIALGYMNGERPAVKERKYAVNFIR
ncbi:MAG: nitroreductase family protein [Oscillospiraceae bacterium]|jgi:nitroreductase